MARRKGLARMRRTAAGDGKIRLGCLWFLAPPIDTGGWNGAVLRSIADRLGPDGLHPFGGEPRLAGMAAWAASDEGREKKNHAGRSVYEIDPADVRGLIRHAFSELGEHIDPADPAREAAAALDALPEHELTFDEKQERLHRLLDEDPDDTGAQTYAD